MAVCVLQIQMQTVLLFAAYNTYSTEYTSGVLHTALVAALFVVYLRCHGTNVT